MSERRLTEHGAFSVMVIDMYHYDPSADLCVAGFPTFELAREYARRRTRDSLEELRGSDTSSQDLREAWFVFGEDCIVVGAGEYRGASEIDTFIAQPATPEERNWSAIEALVMAGRSM
jgi:hypothetical protein